MLFHRKTEAERAADRILKAIRMTDTALNAFGRTVSECATLLQQRQELVDRLCTAECGEVLHRIVRENR